MNKRLIINTITTILILLFSAQMASASLITNSSLEVWSQLENLSDSSGNGNTLTNFGASSVSGCFNNSDCYDFVSAGNDYMNYGDKFEGYNTMTFCARFNSTTTGTNKDILTKHEVFVLRKSNGNKIQAFIYDTGYKSTIGTTTILTNTWYSACGVYDGTNIKVYVNGVQEGTPTAVSFINSAATDALIGNLDGSSTYFDGRIDDVFIYNQTLNSTEILLWHNEGLRVIPKAGNKTLTYNTLEINNVSISSINYLNDTTPTFFTNITNTTTNGNVNNTIRIYNSTPSLIITNQYANNSLTGTFTPSSALAEGIYNVSFYAENNETNVSAGNYSVFIDTTPPNIQLINNVSGGSFAVNFSNIFNVTDALSGLASCTINITELENVSTPDNFFINCTDAQTFTSAGLHNAFVEAQDNAGNKNTFSYNFTINPYIYVFFNDTLNGSLVKNYNAIIYHPDGRIIPQLPLPDGSINLSPVNNGSLDLGIHTITFAKLGYVTHNFSVLVNATNGGRNITFNTTNSAISITIRDKGTGVIVTNETFILEIIGNVGLVTNTSNGTILIRNSFITAGAYELATTSTNYDPEVIQFSFDNRELLELTVYVLNSTGVNTGTIIVNCVDKFGKTVVGSVASALQWNSNTSSYIEVSQSVVREGGTSFLNIILNTKQYIFTCNFANLYTNSTAQFVPTALDDSTIILRLGVLQTTADSLFGDIIYDTDRVYDSTTRVSNITFTWRTTSGNNVEGCVNYYRIYNNQNRILIDQDCDTFNNGILYSNKIINSSFDIIAELGFVENSIFYTVDYYNYYSTLHISEILKSYNWHYYVLPLLYIISIVIGMRSLPIGAIGVIMSSGTGLYLVPDFMTKAIVAFMMFIGFLIMIGGNKKK